jgi:hypothetical protein
LMMPTMLWRTMPKMGSLVRMMCRWRRPLQLQRLQLPFDDRNESPRNNATLSAQQSLLVDQHGSQASPESTTSTRGPKRERETHEKHPCQKCQKRERERGDQEEPTENYYFDSRRRDSTKLLFEYTGLADEANHFDSRRRYYQKLLMMRVVYD